MAKTHTHTHVARGMLYAAILHVASCHSSEKLLFKIVETVKQKYIFKHLTNLFEGGISFSLIRPLYLSLSHMCNYIKACAPA